MTVARRLPLLLLAAAALAILPSAAALGLRGPDGAGVADRDREGAGADAALADLPVVPAVAPVLPGVVEGLPAEVPVPDVGVEASVAGVDVAVQAGPAAPVVEVGLPPQPVPDPPRSRFQLDSVAEQAPAYVAPAAGAGLLVTLGALAWRALSALLPSLPLFSRIERDRLLDNPVRARVHDAVAQQPGLSLSDVAAQAGIAWGTAVHHLRRLEANRMVVSLEQGGHRRFFAANTPAAAQRTAVAVVVHPTARRIAHLVAQRPGIDQRGICDALRLNNPAASKHLGRFEREGLVLSQRAGRSRHYHATGGLHSALVLLDPAAEIASAPATPAQPGLVHAMAG